MDATMPTYKGGKETMAGHRSEEEVEQEREQEQEEEVTKDHERPRRGLQTWVVEIFTPTLDQCQLRCVEGECLPR